MYVAVEHSILRSLAVIQTFVVRATKDHRLFLRAACYKVVLAGGLCNIHPSHVLHPVINLTRLLARASIASRQIDMEARQEDTREKM